MKNSESKQYLTRDYKLYVFFYILCYLFVVIGSKPDQVVEMWKFYFPFKSVAFMLTIELANLYDMMRENYYTYTFDCWGLLVNIDYWRFMVVTIIACFFNIFLMGIIYFLVKYFTGYSLWFIFT